MLIHERHDEKNNSWRGESEDERYAYVLYDFGSLFPVEEPYIYAHNFAEAMSSAAGMVSDGIEQVGVGLPNGEFIEIDARHTNAGFWTGDHCNTE